MYSYKHIDTYLDIYKVYVRTHVPVYTIFICRSILYYVILYFYAEVCKSTVYQYTTPYSVYTLTKYAVNNYSFLSGMSRLYDWVSIILVKKSNLFPFRTYRHKAETEITKLVSWPSGIRESSQEPHTWIKEKVILQCEELAVGKAEGKEGTITEGSRVKKSKFWFRCCWEKIESECPKLRERER